MRIPQRIVECMDHVYREMLVAGTSLSNDDAVFNQAMVAAGARWHIFHILERLPGALQRDRLRGPTSLRQQFMAWLTASSDLSEEFNHFVALGKTAQQLRAQLRKIWPHDSDVLPFYPVFRD